MSASETPVCDCPEPCACYTEGYAAGKDKAYFEIEMTLQDDTHAGGCSSRPCRIKRAVMETALLASNSLALRVMTTRTEATQAVPRETLGVMPLPPEAADSPAVDPGARSTVLSWVRNTTKSYLAGCNDFTSWCLQHRCPGLPADPAVVGRYLEDLVETQGKALTLPATAWPSCLKPPTSCCWDRPEWARLTWRWPWPRRP